MSTDRMEALDAEIGRFVREQLEREGPVTGWVLCFSTVRYDDDGDPLYAWDHAVGPQTSLMTAVGLVHTVGIELDQVIWQAAREDSPGA